ncbi:MAG TPA: DUF4386 domain-containing protein [Anaerolineales bacterium]|nr:DUF4386 domain-containing protein [Anaerolineales bacterium]
MTDNNIMGSPSKLARKTGVLYFLVILLGIASEVIVHNFIFVPGDITATINHITTYESVFRLGFVISLTRFTVFILLILSLYKIFGSVDKDWSLTMVVFALISISIGMVSLFFQYAAPLLLSSNGYSNLFTTNQWHALVLFFINMQMMGDKASQILAVWLLPLGYLIYKSGLVPKILGVLMVLAGLGYVTDFLIFFLLPNLHWQVAGFAFLGELPFPIWLLTRGNVLIKSDRN